MLPLLKESESLLLIVKQLWEEITNKTTPFTLLAIFQFIDNLLKIIKVTVTDLFEHIASFKLDSIKLILSQMKSFMLLFIDSLLTPLYSLNLHSGNSQRFSSNNPSEIDLLSTGMLFYILIITIIIIININ